MVLFVDRPILSRCLGFYLQRHRSGRSACPGRSSGSWVALVSFNGVPVLSPEIFGTCPFGPSSFGGCPFLWVRGGGPSGWSPSLGLWRGYGSFASGRGCRLVPPRQLHMLSSPVLCSRGASLRAPALSSFSFLPCCGSPSDVASSLSSGLSHFYGHCGVAHCARVHAFGAVPDPC